MERLVITIAEMLNMFKEMYSQKIGDYPYICLPVDGKWSLNYESYDHDTFLTILEYDE